MFDMTLHPETAWSHLPKNIRCLQYALLAPGPLIFSGIIQGLELWHWEKSQLGKRAGVVCGEVDPRRRISVWWCFQIVFPSPAEAWGTKSEMATAKGVLQALQSSLAKSEIRHKKWGQSLFNTTKWKYKGSNPGQLRLSTVYATFMICFSVIPLMCNNWRDRQHRVLLFPLLYFIWKLSGLMLWHQAMWPKTRTAINYT